MTTTIICAVLGLLLITGCSESEKDKASESPPEMTMEKLMPDTADEAADEAVSEVMQDEMVDAMSPGDAYLYINSQKPGVKVTESGLQFEILNAGDGATPTAADTVLTHYHGTFIDGSVFDSSVERNEPISFPVTGVIKGWVEALQMMKEGDKWRIVLPSDLAYGERGNGRIPPNTVLVFEVELLKVIRP